MRLSTKLLMTALVASAAAGAADASTNYKLTVLQPIPGYNRTAAGSAGEYSIGINNAGQTTGRSRGGPSSSPTAATSWNTNGIGIALATPTGAAYSRGYDINDKGVAVGTIAVGGVGDDFKRAVRWTTPGTYDYFLTDNGFYSDTAGINNNGWITGIQYFAPQDGVSFRAFVWSPDGTTRWISALAPGHTVTLQGINGSNVAAGFDIDQNTGAYTAVRWTEAGGLVALQAGGGGFDLAVGINDLGVATGLETNAGGSTFGARWDAAGNLIYLNQLSGAVGSDSSYGINNFGVSTGDTLFASCADSTNITCFRATIWDAAGNPTNLNDVVDPALGYTLLTANGINDHGLIFGQLLRGDGLQFAYLLTPVPEPGTWAMMLVGFGLVGAVARRRSRVGSV